MSHPKVLVLLACYNGELWLKEQLDSILNQDSVDVDIYCSVDLSTDRTLEILECYNINILPYGERFGGAGPNFYRLFRDVSFKDYDYIALSDQDDIWLSDKLSSAIKQMTSFSADGFSSDVIAFWPDNKQSLVKKSYKPTSCDHFFESPGPGCSFVLSAQLAKDFQNFLYENNEIGDLHDWFIYAFSRCNDYSWYISNEPKILYRQHGNNQCGANTSLFSILTRLKIMKSGWYRKQILLILNTFDVNSSLRCRIYRCNFFDRLSLAAQSYKYRRKPLEKIMLSFSILFGFL
ncbi:glycosyltransferase [Vibrio sp.]|nr:glycosyltransferase [Vibrio sp.]